PTRLEARCVALYALRCYLPLSLVARGIRRLGRRARGAANRQEPVNRLPEAGWRVLLPARAVRLAAPSRANGNVRLSELAVLAQAAAATEPNREIVEIGTFDGRTTLNLAINSSSSCRVFTLDLPPEAPTRFPLDRRERKFVEKPAPGARFRGCDGAWEPAAARITQLLGDSASYDWSAHEGKAGLVFVDGSHAYEYAKSDSEAAFRLVVPGGMVLWHDYGVWPGVTRYLEELEERDGLGLRRIQGTSLIFWRRPSP
ncbi:MAG TPA: class I SAM-dependent methyltransferase, partial [Candidatus Polarisedimenticolaceae bacterium]|nr:class I SAM-dependent methyltransferase [Candidatus Polarisedimenticolaceae bacterium]